MTKWYKYKSQNRLNMKLYVLLLTIEHFAQALLPLGDLGEEEVGVELAHSVRGKATIQVPC